MRIRAPVAMAIALGASLATYGLLRPERVDAIPAAAHSSEVIVGEVENPPQIVLLGRGRTPASDSSDRATNDISGAPAARSTADLQGVVLDADGVPISGIAVSARSVPSGAASATQPAMQDAALRTYATFSAKAPGEFVMTASGKDGRFSMSFWESPGFANLSVGAFESQTPPPTMMGVELERVAYPTHDLVLRLSRAAYIEGTVVDERGNPRPSVGLTATADAHAVSSRRRVTVSSDAQGHFKIGPLRPGGWTLITAPQSGWTYTETTAKAPADEVTVRLVRAVTLRGWLTGPDVGGFEVHWFLAPGPEGPRRGTVKTTVAGRFEITGLPRGSLRLFARRIGDDRFALVEEARSDDEQLLMPLIPGLGIEGRSDHYEGRVIAHQGELQTEGRAEGGKFRITGLPPGRWILRRVERGKIPDSTGAISIGAEWEVGVGTPSDAGSVDTVLDEK